VDAPDHARPGHYAHRQRDDTDHAGADDHHILDNDDHHPADHHDSSFDARGRGPPPRKCGMGWGIGFCGERGRGLW
jgi:hypothetical protein